jgi:hypothetical protein
MNETDGLKHETILLDSWLPVSPIKRTYGTDMHPYPYWRELFLGRLRVVNLCSTLVRRMALQTHNGNQCLEYTKNESPHFYSVNLVIRITNADICAAQIISDYEQ